jgi:ABC-type multidrug transport system fused ATPase/permease subunit
MDVYRCSPEAVDRFISRSNRVAIPAMVLAFAATVVILHVLWSMTWFGLVFTGLFFGGIMFFAMRRSRDRLRSSLGSAVVVVSEDKIELQKTGSATAIAERGEITRIRESVDRGLTVQSGRKAVIIPAYMERYDELRQQLSSWRPIETDRRPLWSMTIAGTAAFLCLFIAFFVSSNISVVIATGAVVFVVILAGGIVVLRSPNFDRKFKALWAMTAPIPLLIILARIYWVLR